MYGRTAWGACSFRTVSRQLVRFRQQTYQEHAEAVLRLAKTYLKDQAKAEDLTHDVFERLWRGNQFQEDKGSLRSYLLMMTRSMALNQLNQHKNRRSILERWRGEFKQQTASGEPELQASERAAELQLQATAASSRSSGSAAVRGHARVRRIAGR